MERNYPKLMDEETYLANVDKSYRLGIAASVFMGIAGVAYICSAVFGIIGAYQEKNKVNGVPKVEKIVEKENFVGGLESNLLLDNDSK